MIEMKSHEYFEELCALAALGQVSDKEFAEVREHIPACSECQSAYSEFADILHNKLPLADTREAYERKFSSIFREDDKYKKRFLACARERGIQVSDEAASRRTVRDRLSAPAFSGKYASALVIFVLVLVVALSVSRWRESNARNSTAAAEIARLSNENTSLRQQVAELSQEGTLLQTGLSEARAEQGAISARFKQLEEQFQQTFVAWQDLKKELEQARTKGIQASNKLEEANQALRALNQELLSLQQARSQDATTLASQEAQIAALSSKLREQTEMIERERRLLVADRDIRELMGARNLHIIDVFDVDGKGNNKRAFGRIFYTEGKSLIFYAFDLAGQPRVSTADYSFQAWGHREGSSASAVSLGILYMDNEKQRRWVLKFEDPQVLNQIDALFVTVEPFGGGKRPTGEKLLYAYLGHPPNHP